MNKNALALLALLSLIPACTVTTTGAREVGSVAADGSVYLGWHLINRDNKKNNGNDLETYDIGANLGNFSTIRLHSEKPVTIAQLHVIFANGERWDAPAPAAMNNDEWSAPIQLPGGPRPIHSIQFVGRSTTALLSKVEIYGGR